MTIPEERQDESQVEWFHRSGVLMVPDRLEMIANLLSLMPFQQDESFSVTDVGCGDAFLGECLLTMFPNCEYQGLDGSPSMRHLAVERLSRFGSRADIKDFFVRYEEDQIHQISLEIVTTARETDVVVATFFRVWPLDHLQDLFLQLLSRVSSRGAMLFADQVASEDQDREKKGLAEWEAHVGRLGREDLVDIFNQMTARDTDTTPTIEDRLRYCEKAGLLRVAAYWSRASHYVYGGFAPGAQVIDGDSRINGFLRTLAPMFPG